MTFQNHLDELLRITTTLNRDEMRCAPRAQLYGSEQDFWRRMIFRAFFAQVEGVTHRMKQIAELAAPQFGNLTLSNRELARIRNLKYDRKNDAIGRSQSFEPTADTVKFAFDIFVRSHGTSIDLKLGSDPRWADFGRCVDVRNGITHPKDHSDLIISDEDVDSLIRASGWYAEKVAEAKNIVLQRLAMGTPNLPIQGDTERRYPWLVWAAAIVLLISGAVLLALFG